MSLEARISLASSAQASKASSSERTSVLSQSKRRVVIYLELVIESVSGKERTNVRHLDCLVVSIESV